MTTYEPFVCYKCEANEVSAPVGTVHPLCEPCEKEHTEWMSLQLYNLGS